MQSIKVTPIVATLCLRMRYDFEFARKFVSSSAESINTIEENWFALGEMKNLHSLAACIFSGFADIDVSDSVPSWSINDISSFLQYTESHGLIQTLFTYVDTIRLLGKIAETADTIIVAMPEEERVKALAAIPGWFNRAFKSALVDVK